MANLDARRHRMVRRQVADRGIRDARILEAMSEVPRHRFVEPALLDRAYEDTPLPIGHGQTISQPYMVAWALERLHLCGDERVLEVGTGSGYQTALLARLSREVWSVEIVESLHRRAREILDAVGVRNVHLRVGDGGEGVPEEAPFDRILIAAAVPVVPRPLVDQLGPQGILEAPVGSGAVQEFLRIRREGDRVLCEPLGRCAFVPLVGSHGFPDPRAPREPDS